MTPFPARDTLSGMRFARALVLTPLLLAMACFSSSKGGPSPEVTFDASTADAGPFDAALHDSPGLVVDSSPQPDAGGNTTVIVVNQNGIPEPGVTLVVGDASGAVVSTATTGAGGTASFDGSAGGQVTAVLGPAGGGQLVTIQGLAVGDAITIRDRTTPSGTINVTVTAIPPGAPSDTATFQAQSIDEISACQSGLADFTAPPATIPVNNQAYCYGGGPLPVLLLAYSPVDASTTTLLGYTYEKSIPVDLEAGTATASSFVPWIPGAGGNLTVQLINEFGAGTTFPADAGVAILQALYTEVTNGQPFDGYGQYTTLLLQHPIDGGSPLPPWQYFPGFGDFEQPELDYFIPANGGVSATAIATRVPTPAQGDLTVTFDFSTWLPPIRNATLDTTSPQQPSVTLAQSGSLAATDGTLVSITWSEVTDGAPGPRGTWLVVAPPGVTTVTTPALPSSVVPWLPLPSSEVTFKTKATAVDVGSISDYASFRKDAVPYDPVPNYGHPYLPPLPSADTARVTTWYQF